MSNKKKIGIVTYWESLDNYGQQLQCWALQRFLHAQGYNPFLVRVRMFTSRNKKHLSKYVLKSILQSTKIFIGNLLIACGGLKWKYTAKLITSLNGKDWAYRRFESFRRKYIKSTHIYNSYAELASCPPKADAYIAGSDQIWNADLQSEIWKITFLQFGDEHIKRIAYAPSMSICDMTKEQEQIFEKYLQSFDALSAREEKTVKKCSVYGCNCELVIDPTLLISSESYNKIAQPKHKNPYIFLYTINYETNREIPSNQELRRIIGKDACDVVVTTGGGYIKNVELLQNDVVYDYATIPAWIGNIMDAELVVTPSFHGIVFAIIFHRNFIFTPLQGRFAKGNERVFDLLNRLSIKGHIWGREDVNAQIDWEQVDALLENLKKRSQIFLMNAIN